MLFFKPFCLSKFCVKMRKLSKKGFCVDKITEDSFYENLLLGLPSLLKASPFVSHIKIERYKPATCAEIAQWELLNNFNLPKDLYNFFLSTNGFQLTYLFQYDKAETDSLNLTGIIEIYPLSALEKIRIPSSTYMTQGGARVEAPESKIHVLCKVDCDSCVVLAQFNPTRPPNIWLYYKMTNFYFMCENVMLYLRMAIAHVGAPGWQYKVMSPELPEWSAEMLQLLAPGIFNRAFSEETWVNELDCDVFDEEESRKTPRGKMRK